MSVAIRSDLHPSRQRFQDAVFSQLQVLHALMMHDIKSRFFGSGIGYIVTILWPAAHIAIVVAIFYFSGRVAPYGDDPLLYASTGVLPFMIWNYVSRFTMLGVSMNRAFLQYPVIKPLDIMIARQALETVTSVLIVVGVVIFLYASGRNPMPLRLDDAALALFSAWLLGIGFGVFNGVICMIFPLWNVIYIGVIIGTWIACGIALQPEQMPTQIGDLLAWIPLLHSVELMRLAYYEDFPARLLDREYVLYWGGGLAGPWARDGARPAPVHHAVAITSARRT